MREFVEAAFARVDLDWKEYVKHDARYERPAEVDLLIGDPAKAKKQLGWEPKVRFNELVKIMVDADLTGGHEAGGVIFLAASLPTQAKPSRNHAHRFPSFQTMKIKRALISVSDKTGIVQFARELVELGVEIISTGGTASLFKSEGVPAREISEFTGFRRKSSTDA